MSSWAKEESIRSVCKSLSFPNQIKEWDCLNGLRWGDDLEETTLFRQIVTNAR